MKFHGKKRIGKNEIFNDICAQFKPNTCRLSLLFFVIFISNSTQKQTRNTVAFCVPRENRKNDCYLYFSKALQAIDIVTQYCAKNMTVIILPS